MQLIQLNVPVNIKLATKNGVSYVIETTKIENKVSKFHTTTIINYPSTDNNIDK